MDRLLILGKRLMDCGNDHMEKEQEPFSSGKMEIPLDSEVERQRKDKQEEVKYRSGRCAV